MNALLYVILACFGYVLVLSLVLPHVTNSRDITTVAVTVLALYGSIVGMFLMLGKYLGEPGLVLYAASIVYVVMFWCWKIWRTAHKRIRFHGIVLGAFVAYLAVIFFMTVIGREAGSNFRVQMDLFNFTKYYALESMDHAFLNMLVFVPVGAMFPLLTPGTKGKTLGGMSFGMLVTVLIETLQLVLHSGTCDIDDIICNSFGALVGAAVVSGLLKVKYRDEDEWP